MKPTLVLSACDVLQAKQETHRQHAVTFLRSATGDPSCAVCSVEWPSVEAYLAGFRTPCPGYTEAR